MADNNRRMRIRQFFPAATDNEYFNNIWNMSLKIGIQKILEKKHVESFEELYRNAYTMVLYRHGEQVYKGAQEVILNHLVQEVMQDILEASLEEFLTKLKSAWDDYRVAIVKIRDVLNYMDRVYVSGQRLESIYNVGLILFRDNIVRYPIIRERLQNTLLETVEHEQYNDIVHKTTWRGIYQMLMSLGMDSRSVYEVDLETPFLQKLTEFYENERQILPSVENGDISEYFREISTLLDEISQWIFDCFDKSTKERVIGVLQNKLITKHANHIVIMIEKSIINMLTLNRYDELETIYKYLEHIPDGYSAISKYVSNYLHEEERILSVTNEEHNLHTSVQSLVDLKDTLNNFLNISTKYDNTILEQIQFQFKHIINTNEYLVKHLLSLIDDQLNKEIKSLNDEQINGLFKKIILLYYSNEKDLFEKYYQKIKQQLSTLIQSTNEFNKTNASVQLIENILYVKDIFDMFIKIASNEEKKNQFKLDLEYIITGNENVPECLSLFIHDKLQKIDHNCDDQTISILFDKVLILLHYLPEKDVFERWYQSHFVQRLLLGKPMLQKMEDNMILRLKTQCSSQFIYHLQCMFKDISVSETIMKDFRSSMDLNVRVLTIDVWPIQNLNSQCNLPASVNEVYECFKKFYLNKYHNRCLTLQSNFGTADLTAIFYDQSKEIIKERKYMLHVSTHQMIILMLFNTKDSFSFEEIQQQTNINEIGLRRALLSLITNEPRQNILRKEPNNYGIQPNDVFYINDLFISKQFRIKLKQIREKSDSNIEQAETQNKIQFDRRSRIDALIIRIMKANKTMEHTQLIIQVMDQMKKRFQVRPQLIEERIKSLITSDYISQPDDNIKSYNYVP